MEKQEQLTSKAVFSHLPVLSIITQPFAGSNHRKRCRGSKRLEHQGAQNYT